MDSPSRKPRPNRDNDLNGSSLVSTAAKRVTGLGTKIRSMTSEISKTEDNVAMSSQSRLRKFNYVGLIALGLLMGLVAVTSFAAVSVSTNRLTVTTGQKSADAVTVTLSGLETGSTITIKPPLYSTYSATATTDDNWTSMVGDPDLTNDADGVTSATEGLVTADAFTLNNSHIQVNAGGNFVSFTNGTAFTSVTVSYHNARSPAITGRVYFEITVTKGATTYFGNGATIGGNVYTKSNNWFIVSANGSGTVTPQDTDGVDNDGDTKIDEPDEVGTNSYTGLVSGTANQAIQFNYTAPGTGGAPADFLNNGTLEIVFPSDLEAPVPGAATDGGNLIVATETTDTGLATAHPYAQWTVSGSTVGLKIADMDGGDVLSVIYTPATLPVVTANATKTFTFRVGDAAGATPINLASGATQTITIVPAAAGSGKVTFSGLEAVPAGSSGHEILITYEAEGTMDGGFVEMIPPTGWTTPQGVAGVAGYTVVEVPAGKNYTDVIELVSFEDTDNTIGNFSGNGVGVKIKQLRLGESFTIAYGKTGTTSGAVAQASAGPNNEFTFYAVPNEGDNTVITPADDYLDLFPHGYVNVGAGDGGDDTDGSATATLIGIKTAVGGAQVTSISAGQEVTFAFTYKTAGPIYNGGMFSVTIPGNWPAPVKGTNIDLVNETADAAAGSISNNGLVDISQGTFDAAYVYAGREFRVPIRSMSSAGKVVTVAYKAIAPAFKEDSQFIFKAKGTDAGTLSVIKNKKAATATEAALDLSYFPVAVGKAAAGSGKIGVLASQNVATAGSTGNLYSIVYEAVGEMDGGKLQLISPAGWTVLKDHLSFGVTGSASLTAQTFGTTAAANDTVTYDITTMRRGDRVNFTYSGVTVPTDVTTTASFQVKVSSGDDDTDTLAAVTADLDGTAADTIDNDADGTVDEDGEGATYIVPTTALIIDEMADGKGTAVIDKTTQDALATASYTITYTPLAQMVDGKVELTIPADWTTPSLTNTDAGFITAATDVDGSGATAPVTVPTVAIGTKLDLNGRVLTVSGIDLDENGTVVFTYGASTGATQAAAPVVAGTYTFAIRSQGSSTGSDGIDNDGDTNVDEADEDDGRALSAIETSPTVVVGPVGKGIGFAYLSNNLVEDKEGAEEDFDGNEIKGQVLSARWNRNQRFVNAGNSGQTAVITFEAVGTMDGGDVRFEMPNLLTNPQNSSSIADGYVSVTTSSGVGIGSMYFPTLNARAVDIPITSMGKGGTITLTYRLTDSQIAVENTSPGYQFRVYTKFGASDTFSQGAGAAGELSATTNTAAKTTAVDGYERSNAIYNDRLVLRVNSVAGTGSAHIVGNSVFRKSVFAGSDSGAAVSFGSVNLVIRYQADSKVGSFQIKIPTAAGIGGGGIRGWTKPVSPAADADPIGEVASSLGDVVATGGNIIVTNLNLIPGQTIDVTYARASYLYGVNDGTGYVNISGATTLANTVTAGGEETFVVQSSGNAAGGSWADIARWK